MNPLDFEKTRIFANKAKEAQAATPVSPSIPTNIPPSLPVSTPAAKPTIKKLSKEEKILLATGGVLTLGLGAIVIVSMKENVEPTDVVSTNSSQPLTQAPIIETENGITPDKPANQLPSKPVIHESKHTETHKHVNDQSHSLIDIPDEPSVATNVTDDMSFDEAFKIARAEVGPGGLFVWNDTYYGTFNESEWDSLPEAKKELWISAVEPIIDPAEPAPFTGDDHVVIADRGEIIWTGIDKNGDGVAEVLTARVQGQPPIVMVDTDNDGKLDTRYFLDSATGQVASAPMEQTVMEMNNVNEIPQIDAGSTFHTASYEGSRGPEDMPVTIMEENGMYIVGIDMDGDALVDIVSLNKDGQQPFVAMDMDNDGQIETSYLYNPELEMVVSNENQPLEPMLLPEQEQFPDETYTAYNENGSIDDSDRDEDEDNSDNHFVQSDANYHGENLYFNNQSEAADDFVA